MGKNKISKEEIKKRSSDYRYNQYTHGGSRIYIDGESGDRQLIVDTYYDEDFAKFINEKVQEYFNLKGKVHIR